MVILQVIACIIVYSMPLFVGLAIGQKSIPEAYLFGQVAIWAGFQIVAVPMILLHCSFWILVIVFSIIVVAVVGYGIYKYRDKITNLRNFSIKKIDFNLLLIPALVLIAYQVCMYIFGQHLDEDDARWIAEANDALVHNRMLLHNPLTGDYIGHPMGEMEKDVFSPWCMFLAYLSRVTFLSPAVTAHTVYAPILLILAYLVYYLIGKDLFEEKLERGAFLLFVSLIFLLEKGVYTQARFSLVRIWQGKASVAAIIIPLFLCLLLRIEKSDTKNNWILFGLSSAAGCLFSGMGIAISLVLAGIYGLYAVVLKRIKRIPFYLISLFFPTIFGILYYLFYMV